MNQLNLMPLASPVKLSTILRFQMNNEQLTPLCFEDISQLETTTFLMIPTTFQMSIWHEFGP